MSNQISNSSRRNVLKALGGIGASAIAPIGLNMAAISKAAALNANDYKALVFINLNGGNDQYNTLVPIDTVNYQKYKLLRGTIALNQTDLIELNSSSSAFINPKPHPALKIGINKRMSALADIFNNGDLATLFNVGTLERPTSKSDYFNNKTLLPNKLFSHNDQTKYWQTFTDNDAASGWGGELINLADNVGQDSDFSSISIKSSSALLQSNKKSAYTIGTNGATPIHMLKINAFYQSYEMRRVFEELLTLDNSNNYMAKEYIRTLNRSIDFEGKVSAALDTLSPGDITTVFPTRNQLAEKLKMVAKLIKVNSELGNIKRQVFFVEHYGFDSHEGIHSNHPILLGEVSEAIAAFYNATKEIGLANNVTSFTASEFGRSLTSNGNGTDHGWGSHHMIIGGAVNGGKHYGHVPEMALNTDVDIGQGRLLPTTSLAQYISTLVTWFGVEAHELPYLIPNINNFSQKNLGFL